jgi:C-terminal processing protease CtpA/Prc
LIVDLRGNSGGNTEVCFPLLKYIYTQPFEIFGACNLATTETIEIYKKALRDTVNNSKEELASYRLVLDRLLKSRGKIVCDTIEIKKFPEVLTYPQNVAIIMDNLTLSAAELFILIAQQSKKIKLFGEYSGGTVDFGAVLEYKTGCKKYELSLPMQTNTDYPKKKYDLTGIKPDIFVPDGEKDWIHYIISYYGKNK